MIKMVNSQQQQATDGLLATIDQQSVPVLEPKVITAPQNDIAALEKAVTAAKTRVSDAQAMVDSHQNTLQATQSITGNRVSIRQRVQATFGNQSAQRAVENYNDSKRALPLTSSSVMSI
jgi:hypothetical protein